MKDLDIGQSIINVQQRKRARLTIPSLNIGVSSESTSAVPSGAGRQMQASGGDVDCRQDRQGAGPAGVDHSSRRRRSERTCGKGLEERDVSSNDQDAGLGFLSLSALQADQCIGIEEMEDPWVPERTDDMTSEAIIAAAVRPSRTSHAGALHCSASPCDHGRC